MILILRLRLQCFWLKLSLIVLQLRRWWINVQLWWWSREIDILDVKDEEPTITNIKGAKQSDIEARFDLLPALAVKRVAQVLHRGEQTYGAANWRRLSVEECHNHTLGHAIGFNRSNAIEDLAHTACRALMTLELALVEEERQ
jgi:hypothetical protein